MAVKTVHISLSTKGKGTIEITDKVAKEVSKSGIDEGTVTIFCRHTSCSLVLMENADPSARQDLHYYMDKLVPENDPGFVHTYEGPDDMPSHIKMALTRSAEVIPFENGRMTLGTWQGIFLWEHRRAPHRREIVLSIQGE